VSSRPTAGRRRDRVGLGRIALIVACAFIFLFLMTPILIVLPVSFSSASYLTFPPPGFSLQWYQNYFGQGTWVSPTLLSIEVAAVVGLLSTALGVPAALALVRGTFPGRGIIRVLALSPMIVPEIIISIAIFYSFASLHIVGSRIGLILSQTALGIPFVVINVSAALYGVDGRLERAAQVLGASPLRTFWSITLPLIRPGVLAGALFAFLASWDDLLLPLFLSGSSSVTLPLRMWQGLRDQIDPTASAVSSLLIVISTLILLAAEFVRRRGERLRTRPVEEATPAVASGLAAIK